MYTPVSSIKTTFVILVMLILLALIASSPLFVDGWFDAADTVPHLVRLNNVIYEMSNNDFYPRWLTMANLGKGAPVLNFYAPGFYLIVGYLHMLGLPLEAALKMFCYALFFLGSMGIFIWTKKHFGGVGAFLSASIYMFVPYHFVDIYVRSALPEFAALALLPFLFYSIDKSFSLEKYYLGIVLTAITSAAIVLTHNLSALMIIPFALVYFGWCAFGVSLQRIQIACLGPLLGAALSAFYWLPVIIETKYLGTLSSAISGNFHYSRHFLHPFQWGLEDVNSQIGYVLLVCIVVSLITLFFTSIEIRSFGLITLFLGSTGLFMTTSLSMPIYKLITVFEYVQFPWRFLGPATLFFAAFCGLVVSSNLTKENIKIRGVFCIVVVILCILLSGNQRKVEEQLHVSLEPGEFRKDPYLMFIRWTEKEFMPKGITIDPRALLNSPMLANGKDYSYINSFNIGGSKMSLRVSAGQNSEVVLPWFYFPGWKARYDDVSVPVYPSPLGLATFAVPSGEHTAEVWFGTTWPRITGWLLASMSIVSIAIILRISFRKQIM